MKIVVQSYSNGELQLIETPSPIAVKGGSILINNHSSLVSAGTEKSMIEVAKKSILGKALARPDWVKQVIDKVKSDGLLETYRQAQARLDNPIPMGYSSAGTVSKVGKGMTEFSVGDRVACSGSGYASHAEMTTVPRNLCVKIPERVSFEEASFVALGGIALEAVRMAKPELGHKVVVIGLGLLGQLTVQLLKANGCHVLGVDLVHDKLELAKSLGADQVANGNIGDVNATVQAFSHGEGADSVVIMASTDSNQPIEQAAEICRERGRVVAAGLVGLDIPRKPFYEKEIEFVVSRAWGPGMYDPDYEERDIKYPLAYARWTAKRNMAAFLDLVAEGKVDVKSLITHRYPFDDALDAYRMILEGKESYIGVVLDYAPDEVEPLKKINLQPQEKRVAIKSDEIGIGLIGAGLYARGTLMPAMNKVNGVHYRGVATRSGMSGQHVGEKFGFDYCTTNYQELLEDKGIHAVFVLTRHGSHVHFTKEALRAGKAVFVEKPLAMNKDELAEIVEAWKDGSGFLTVGFNRRYAPTTRFIQKRINSNTAPMVALCRCNAGYIPHESWVHDPQEGGGRIIGEACHFVDLFQALTGGLTEEVYVENIDGPNAELHDNFTATLKMDNGAVGSLVYTAGGDKSFPREYVEVFGGGSVGVIENFKSAKVTQCGKTSRIGRFNLGVDRGQEGELQTFFEHLREGSSQPVAIKDYVATTLATFAMEESILAGKPVSISIDSFLSENI